MQTKHDIMSRTRLTGITLVETVLSLVILGGAFVAALNTIGSARGAQTLMAQRQLGLVLAEDLMAEVLSHNTYKEGLLFGPESGESFAGRSTFDAVDDYDGWRSSPPVDASGAVIVGTEGYRRTVDVVYVRLDQPSITSLTDQGIVRITVTVLYGSKTVATLNAYRTDAWQAPQEVN